MTEYLATWHHDRALLDPRSDAFECVTITAAVDEYGPHVTLGDYKLGAVEARELAASLLLAADRVDPDHLEQRLRDNADAELARLIGDDR